MFRPLSPGHHKVTITKRLRFTKLTTRRLENSDASFSFSQNTAMDKTWVHKFSKNLGEISKFQVTQKGDMQQVPHQGPTNIRRNKVKVKFTLEQAMKTQRKSRGIALLFLEPRRQIGVGGQRHAPADLLPEKTRYPFYRRLGGPQGRSGYVRKISPTTGIRSPDRPARSESLYRLS